MDIDCRPKMQVLQLCGYRFGKLEKPVDRVDFFGGQYRSDHLNVKCMNSKKGWPFLGG